MVNLLGSVFLIDFLVDREDFGEDMEVIWLLRVYGGLEEKAG